MVSAMVVKGLACLDLVTAPFLAPLNKDRGVQNWDVTLPSVLSFKLSRLGQAGKKTFICPFASVVVTKPRLQTDGKPLVSHQAFDQNLAFCGRNAVHANERFPAPKCCKQHAKWKVPPPKYMENRHGQESQQRIS